MNGRTVTWSLSDVDLRKLPNLELLFETELLAKKELLTWNRSALAVVKAGQETTLHPYDTCKASGTADVVTLRGRQDSDDEFKRLAAAKGVNVIQILYGEPNDMHNLNWKYYVRCWSCP